MTAAGRNQSRKGQGDEDDAVIHGAGEAKDSDHRPVTAHLFMQSFRDLAKRTILNGANQLLEHVATVLDHDGEPVERARGLVAVPLLETAQAFDLLMLPAR